MPMCSARRPNAIGVFTPRPMSGHRRVESRAKCHVHGCTDFSVTRGM